MSIDILTFALVKKHANKIIEKYINNLFIGCTDDNEGNVTLLIKKHDDNTDNEDLAR